ncbi:hypothetical protein BH09MYX1_BH09MYX1_14540 [soil metagenome]
MKFMIPKHLIAITLALTAAACSAADGSHPTILGATPPDGSDGGTDAAIATNDAGADARSDAATDAAVDGGSVTPPPALPGVCDSTRTYPSVSKLAVSTVALEAMPTASEDGLTVAWITPNDGAVHYADRVDSVTAFTAAKTLSNPKLATGERVALARDGHTLYGVRADRLALVAFTRAASGDDFGAAGTSTLENLDGELVSGESFADVVVGSSSLALVYRRVGGSSPGLRLATRIMPGDAWATSTPFAVQAELAMVGPKARKPTGLSNDRRAIFYFDELSGTEKIGFFEWDATTATTFLDLGARANAQPNSDCTVLTYDTAGDLYTGQSL